MSKGLAVEDMLDGLTRRVGKSKARAMGSLPGQSGGFY